VKERQTGLKENFLKSEEHGEYGLDVNDIITELY
jgi:hypothetical protein